MNHFRFFLGLSAGKLAELVLRLFAGRGSNTPGAIMKKICPDALAEFKLPETVICVTGTNGKTETSNLLTAILRSSGKKVANNSEGSNMEAGLITALLRNADWRGNVKADVAVLEVDERSSPYIYTKITPSHLLCTNLFRDSIKRNGHSEFIFKKMNDYLPESTLLVLNGNDAISGLLGQGKNRQIYYDVERTLESTETCDSITCDCKVCPVCNRELHYDFYHYHHIGRFHCDCGFRMPEPTFSGRNVDFAAGTFSLHQDGKEDLPLIFRRGNLFQVFNITAAAAVCRLLGVDDEVIRKSVEEFAGIQSRFGQSDSGGIHVATMLCKNQNPVSSSRSVAYLNHLEGTKDVVLLITDSKDKVHGSEDISWLYDTDFAPLTEKSVHKVILGGTRCEDLALRLWIAGVPQEKMALYPDYEALCRDVPGLIAPGSTTVIYYELYAIDVAQRVSSALRKGEEE